MDKKDTKRVRIRRQRQGKSIYEPSLCPAIGFSRIVGGKYKLRILWALRNGPKRYGEIRTSLLKGTLGQAITPRVLSRELRELNKRGLIHRKQFAVVPPKVEYTLAERGETLLPILNAIVDWGMTGIHEEILAGEYPAVSRPDSSG
jgi:DNA-binding HxlR family transcriptional regulator